MADSPIIATVCFLVKGNGIDRKILIAQKKRGFGVGKWNGVGGKVDVDVGESVEEGVIRETQEEIFVNPVNLDYVAFLDFKFKDSPEWDMIVHAFISTKWNGIPRESDEMRPKWFGVNDLPYKEMWADDEFWLPQVLEGGLVSGNFVFSDQDTIEDMDVRVVDHLAL